MSDRDPERAAVRGEGRRHDTVTSNVTMLVGREILVDRTDPDRTDHQRTFLPVTVDDRRPRRLKRHGVITSNVTVLVGREDLGDRTHPDRTDSRSHSPRPHPGRTDSDRTPSHQPRSH